MKKSFRVSALCIWMLGATGLLAAWWLRNPNQLSFLNLPEPVWFYLINFFNASCCESVANVELVVALVFAFVATAVVTILVLFLWQHGKRLTSAWSRRR